jgi:hypothetical protein
MPAILKLDLHVSQALPVLKELLSDQRLDQANGSTVDGAAQTRRIMPRIRVPSRRRCGRVIRRTLRKQLLQDLCERNLLKLRVGHLGDGRLGYGNLLLIFPVGQRDHGMLLDKA